MKNDIRMPSKKSLKDIRSEILEDSIEEIGELNHEKFGPMLDGFVQFASKKLGIKSMPQMELTKQEMTTSFGGYQPDNQSIAVVSKNRHPMDVFRTVAHELVHHKQKEDGRLGKDISKEGATGSDIENEANSEAGKLMRWYAKANPEMFKSGYVTEEALVEGINDPGTFKAVFLGGGPGSGKDFVMKQTLAGNGLQEINSDLAFEFLMRKAGLNFKMPESEREPRDKVRGRGKNITKEQQRLALAGRRGVVINGTGDDPAKIAAIKKELEGLGYETMMVFVNTSDKVSKERNLQRGEGGGRAVPEDIRKEKWDACQEAIPSLEKLFGKDNFVKIDNSADLRTAPKSVKDRVQGEFQKIFKMARKFIARQPNENPAASKWTQSEMQKRNMQSFVPASATAFGTGSVSRGAIQVSTALPPDQDNTQQVSQAPTADEMSQAQRLGLTYYGFGRWGSTVKGKHTVTYIGQNGKLVPKPQQVSEMKDDPCWKGYEMIGKKKKNGKKVPNCVPVDEAFERMVSENTPSDREWGKSSLTKIYSDATPGQSFPADTLFEKIRAKKGKKKLAKEDNIPAMGYEFGNAGIGDTFGVVRSPTGLGYGYSLPMSESAIAWSNKEETIDRFIAKYGQDAERKLYEAAQKLSQIDVGNIGPKYFTSLRESWDAVGGRDMGTVSKQGSKEDVIEEDESQQRSPQEIQAQQDSINQERQRFNSANKPNLSPKKPRETFGSFVTKYQNTEPGFSGPAGDILTNMGKPDESGSQASRFMRSAGNYVRGAASSAVDKATEIGAGVQAARVRRITQQTATPTAPTAPTKNQDANPIRTGLRSAFGIPEPTDQKDIDADAKQAANVSKLKNIGAAVSSAGSSVNTTYQDSARRFATKIYNAPGTIKGAATSAGSAISDIANKTGISARVQDGIDNAKMIGSAIGGAATSAGSAIGGAASSVRASIKAAADRRREQNAEYQRQRQLDNPAKNNPSSDLSGAREELPKVDSPTQIQILKTKPTSNFNFDNNLYATNNSNLFRSTITGHRQGRDAREERKKEAARTPEPSKNGLEVFRDMVAGKVQDARDERRREQAASKEAARTPEPSKNGLEVFRDMVVGKVKDAYASTNIDKEYIKSSLVANRNRDDRRREQAASKKDQTKVEPPKEETPTISKFTNRALPLYSPPSIPVNEAARESYRVRSGDTLEKIAKKYGQSLDAVQKANRGRIRDINVISKGQTINLPPSKAKPLKNVPVPPPRPADVDSKPAEVAKTAGVPAITDANDSDGSIRNALSKKGYVIGPDGKLDIAKTAPAPVSAPEVAKPAPVSVPTTLNRRADFRTRKSVADKFEKLQMNQINDQPTSRTGKSPTTPMDLSTTPVPERPIKVNPAPISVPAPAKPTTVAKPAAVSAPASPLENPPLPPPRPADLGAKKAKAKPTTVAKPAPVSVPTSPLKNPPMPPPRPADMGAKKATDPRTISATPSTETPTKTPEGKLTPDGKWVGTSTPPNRPPTVKNLSSAERAHHALETLYGKPMTTAERERLVRLTHAEADWRKDHDMEFAMIGGTTTNRARDNFRLDTEKQRKDPINATINFPQQYQAYTGSSGNGYQPSPNYIAGPSPSRKEAIYKAFADNLHRTPKKVYDFTANDDAAYDGEGVNIGYRNNMRGEVLNRTRMRGYSLPFDASKKAPYSISTPGDDTIDRMTTPTNKSNTPSSTPDNITDRKPPRDAVYEESAAWQRKEGKNPEGGLNKKGIASYRREHPGSKLSLAVTTKPSDLKPGSKAAKRRKKFCARMGGMPGPMKDEKGRPTRKTLSLRKWNCEE
jgi:LysM repeat protein